MLEMMKSMIAKGFIFCNLKFVLKSEINYNLIHKKTRCHPEPVEG